MMRLRPRGLSGERVIAIVNAAHPPSEVLAAAVAMCREDGLPLEIVAYDDSGWARAGAVIGLAPFAMGVAMCPPMPCPVGSDSPRRQLERRIPADVRVMVRVHRRSIGRMMRGVAHSPANRVFCETALHRYLVR